MENAAVAEPESNVCCFRLAVLRVRDEVTGAELLVGDRRARVFLLIRVARNQAAAAAMCDVDEAGAVDSAFRHAAPQIRRSEEAGCLLERVAVRRELLVSDPTRIVVARADPHPAAVVLLDTDGLTAQQFGDALGVVARLGADGGDVDGAEHVHPGQG